MPNFTPEDLLLYDAGELSEAEHNAITQELSVNWALSEKYNVLKQAVARLNAMRLYSPRKQTLQSIMRYAIRKRVIV